VCFYHAGINQLIVILISFLKHLFHYRDYKRSRTIVIVEKVRNFFVGRGGGSVEMVYDPSCLKFTDALPEPSPEQATYEEKKANQKIGEIGRQKLIPMAEAIKIPFTNDDLPF
jgi:hypothetical protein